MTVLGYTQTGYVFTVTTPLGADMLLLQSFEGEERISGLFEFRLDMDSRASAISTSPRWSAKGSPSPAPTRTATSAISTASSRAWCRAGSAITSMSGRLALAAHAGLRQPHLPEQVRARHRQAGAQEQGFTDFQDSLTGTYNPRDYCVQYRETCFDFVSRLMEEEGIFYFFQHADGKHTLVLADDASAFQPCANLASVAFKPESAKAWEEQDLVTGLSLERERRHRQIPDRGFQFRDAGDAAAVDHRRQCRHLQIYEYPGLYKARTTATPMARSAWRRWRRRSG